jgi:group I intron endonuclease
VNEMANRIRTLLQIKGDYKPGIYCIESECGKKYIGSSNSVRARLRHHLVYLKRNNHDNSRLQNYFNKYGESKLKFYAIEYCEKSLLIKKEQHYIDLFNPFFNIARIAGATYGLKPWLGKKHSEETKRLIKQKIIETFSKRPRKEKIVRLTKEQNISRFANLNKSEEARKRISEFHKGNKYWLGKKHKPETIANRTGGLNKKAKPIFCKELNRKFETTKEANEFFGVDVLSYVRSQKKIKEIYTVTNADKH